MNRGLIRLGQPLPCRYCQLPSWLAEADPDKHLHPLHPCCQFWIGQEGRATCVACATFNSRRVKSAGVPAAVPRPGPAKKPLDEDEGFLLALALLRRTDGWVAAGDLVPFVKPADLDQLALAGVEHNGTWFRIS